MKRAISRSTGAALAMLAMTAVLGFTTTASAAPGDFVAEVTFGQDCASGLGVGIAFDGAGHLWVSCASSKTDLLRTNAVTGAVEQTYELAGGLGALAYDSKRNALWAGPGEGSFTGIYFIQLDGTKTVTSSKLAFELGSLATSLDDGLAYDATDDTLYYSPDGSVEIHHLKTNGELIASNPWDGTECYNSGVAIGGELLFEGSDGCSHVWVVNKKTRAASFNFSTFTEKDPNHRDEGLSCDPLTFKATKQQVMWSKEAYSPNRAIAFEIPAETCGFGGKEPKATETTTSLSGGGHSGESITVSEGTAVTDTAKLIGANAGTATGAVTYTVYSDKECAKVVASAGAAKVSGESVPPSNPETLPPGTYYWQASYGGDENNEPSKSACGGEVLTVEKGKATPCEKAVGEGAFKVGKETQSVSNNVSTNLSVKQSFIFHWEGVKQTVRLTKLVAASCVVTPLEKKFSGHGQATLNGAPGYFVKFTIAVTNKGRLYVNVWIYKGQEGRNKVAEFHDGAATGEVIS
jgi:hypothetical protein